MTRASYLGAVAVLLMVGAQHSFAQPQAANRKDPSVVGYTDTPVLPGQKWRVHDAARPRPRVITPAPQSAPVRPPSDAVVLFDGKDLSQWVDCGRGQPPEPKWKVENGYLEVVPKTGHICSKEKFGDVQLHVEWAAPAEVHGAGQFRGNSGVVIMSRYEIQVLDSYENQTYADGQAAAIYGQFPPLVNASRKPGEWQTYDIVFEAPLFEGGKVAKPARVTVFHNGVVVHHRQDIVAPMAHRRVAPYTPHGPEEPLMLQNHGDQVRYRNIWARRLTGYDQPPATSASRR